MCIITRGNPGELYFPRGPLRGSLTGRRPFDSSGSKDAEDRIGTDNWSAISSPLFPLNRPPLPSVLFAHFPVRDAHPGNVLIKSDWRPQLAHRVFRSRKREQEGRYRRNSNLLHDLLIEHAAVRIKS